MKPTKGNNNNDNRQNLSNIIPSVLDDSDRSQTTHGSSSVPAYNEAVKKFMMEEGYGVQISLANLDDDEM